MMLWYKAWRETRARFLTSLAILTIICSALVYYAQGDIRPEWKRDFNYLLFVNQQYLVVMWILCIVLLGMGGIVREKATGTSSLTLALPVSRMRLCCVRAGMGVVEAIVLGVVPWAAVFVISSYAGMPVLVTQIGFYVLLLVGGGLAYFALAVLVSSLVVGEYTAPVVAFGVVLLTAVLSDVWLRRFSLWRLVTADFSVNKNTFILTGPIPWLGILASLSAAGLLLWASIIVVHRREF